MAGQASIVYEGAAGAGGNLFAGTKFFLQQRVPFRNTFKEMITSNGGEVVLLDKQADIIIADHARKDSPAGSFSWTYIDESVKKGRLEDIENHRAGPVERQIREVGSAQPSRTGRTPFTPEDDRVLMDWCDRAERRGIPMGGNEIFKQLEQKNPRHTFQSWKDRWKHYVSKRPRPETREEPEDDEEEADNDVKHASPQPYKHQGRAAVRSNPKPAAPPVQLSARAISKLPVREQRASPARSNRSPESTAPKSTNRNPFVRKSKGGNVFMEEETQMLLDQYDAIMELGEDQVIDAWIAWATENPNHTAQEWRNYFNEYVIPNKADLEFREARKQKRDKPPPPTNNGNKSTHKPSVLWPEPPKPQEVKDSQGSSGQTLSSPIAVGKMIDHTIMDAKAFEEDLLVLADEFKVEVNFNPVISGRSIPLFRLWQVVQSNRFGGFDAVEGNRLWQKVADKLNFNAFKHPSAADDLAACYSEILADFETVKREQMEEENAMAEEEAMLVEQLLQTAQQPGSMSDEHYHEEPQDEDIELERRAAGCRSQEDELRREQEEHDDDLDWVQVSPHHPLPASSSTGKRVHGPGRPNEEASHNKRQRIEKGEGMKLEIPSTPEDVINNQQAKRPSHQPSPLKNKHTEPESASEDSMTEEIVPIDLKRQRPTARKQPRLLEPETQDFHYPPAPEEDVYAESDEETSLFVKQEPPPTQARAAQPKQSEAVTNGSAGSFSNNYESSTQSQTESQEQAGLRAFINKHVEDGYAQDIVIDALEATTMTIKGALKVMDSLADGDGIPENIPGVWTAYDDDALVGGKGTAEYAHIVRKHGIARIAARKRHLSDKQQVAS